MKKTGSLAEKVFLIAIMLNVKVSVLKINPVKLRSYGRYRQNNENKTSVSYRNSENAESLVCCTIKYVNRIYVLCFIPPMLY